MMQDVFLWCCRGCLLSLVSAAPMVVTGCASTPPSENLNYRDKASVVRFLKTTAGWNDKTGFEKRLVDIALPSPGVGDEWKDAWVVFSNTYAELQRAANDRRKIPAASLRADLLAVFERRMKVRGGGSASMAMNIRIPAQVEWTLGHLHGRNCPAINDKALLARSLAGYPFDPDLDPTARTELEAEVRASLDDLKKIEARMTPRETACVRADFLHFFEEKWRNR